MPRRVVIVGMPRSGTTLLASLLHAQKDVQFLTEYLNVFHQILKTRVRHWKETLDEPTRRYALAAVRDQALRLRHACLIRVDGFRTLDDLHRSLMNELASKEHALVGHKVVLKAHEVRRWIEQTDMQAILLLRDPRDAALSYWYINGGGVERYLEGWVAMARLARELSDHPQLITLRFEDLVEDSVPTLARLGERIGCELNTAVGPASFHGRMGGEVPWRGNSAFGGNAGTVEGRAAGRWQELTDEPIVRYAGWRCAREMPHWGYPAGPVLSLSAQARVARDWAISRALDWTSDASDQAVRRLRDRHSLRPRPERQR